MLVQLEIKLMLKKIVNWFNVFENAEMDSEACNRKGFISLNAPTDSVMEFTFFHVNLQSQQPSSGEREAKKQRVKKQGAIYIC